ncbi:hypothetical protein [Singulisphaera sp. PoT]|uniref:hypothetical protein n=1 Tax=Singulisphaera sp. PoT TaxID=3411797 RepID=UPI003BF48FCB
MEGSRREFPWGWAVAWTPVFAANLIVPYRFATIIWEKAELPGMYAGIATFWILGLATCVVRPWLAKRLIMGGIIVAVLQSFPFLHFIAGFVALWFAKAVAPMGPIIFGFVGVILAGCLLLSIAFALGMTIDYGDSKVEATEEKPKPADWPLAD